jgi:ATP-dependent DNA helicase RecQ
LRYVDAATCRHDFILRYFGDEAESLGGCGHCDVCRKVEQTLRDDPEVLERDAVVVRKALSAVARARGRGGTQAVAEMLRGKSTDRVVRFGFDGLSTFGLLAGETQDNVMRVLRALLAAGFIDLTPGDYPMPILTPTGARVMRAEEAVRIRLPRAPAEKLGRATKGRRRSRKTEEDASSPRPAAGFVSGRLASGGSADGTLFEALRVYRMNLASEAGIAPFIVAHDRTLAEIAARRPTTLEELESVPGMGPVKIARYGEGILGIIRRTLGT